MSSQEAALPVRPTVIEAGGEVCEDGHFGFRGMTFAARRAGCVRYPGPSGQPCAQGALCSRGSGHARARKLPAVLGSAPSLPRARSSVGSLSTWAAKLMCRGLSAHPRPPSRPQCTLSLVRKEPAGRQTAGSCAHAPAPHRPLEGVTAAVPFTHSSPQNPPGEGQAHPSRLCHLHEMCQLCTRQAAWVLTRERVGIATHLLPPLLPWFDCYQARREPVASRVWRQSALNQPQGGTRHQTHPWPFGQRSCRERNQSSVWGYRTISVASAERVLTLRG